MRFHFHKTHEIWNRLKDLDLLRREYTSDMPEVPTVGMFITDDEIDATLNRGSNVEAAGVASTAISQALTMPKKKRNF